MSGGHSLNLRRGPGSRVRRHPTRIRDGQVFAPLHGRHHLRVTVRDVDREWAWVVREDRREVRLAVDRLLATDAGGCGRHYRFCGWHPRSRGYRAELRVVRLLPEAARCVVRLPEWDPLEEIEQPLSILPDQLRREGARGSCLANLASPSVAGLAIHSCRAVKLRVGSRAPLGSHPEVLAPGQRYRRRSDGAEFRLLEDFTAQARAWNGRRVVSLRRDRLLAVRADGGGLHYEYLGGGVRGARRQRDSSRR